MMTDFFENYPTVNPYSLRAARKPGKRLALIENASVVIPMLRLEFLLFREYYKAPKMLRGNKF
jgi:hypothetical protein